MSYEANPNFAYGAIPTISAPIPDLVTSISTPVDITTVAPSGGGSRVLKIIIIIVLIILIIISIVLIFIFRSNTAVCENNENPACPILVCPVGNAGVVADPLCGNSAFRIEGGKKYCSTSRYGPGTAV
jgi:hypothetical protein